MNECTSYHVLGSTGVCWGTKECDPCSCGGDMSKCDYYPELRKRANAEDEREATIELTKDEAYAIAEHIDMTLLDELRDNTDIDSIQWLRSMIHGYEKLCAFSGYVGLTEDRPRNRGQIGDEITAFPVI